ncbi:hypothetical protein ALI22I_05775 [Saccharothrix sp. ALI-22-I]|uniref:DUF3040 domain-containing protein n=1 Tax=Saccharothrix sp. ALI-22-I TaxID=1933778 RepID=UPI00097C9044|nr:DUF3040 domain-containing protein [Saccharothrix sp. ALI-22-I]ONI92119.1 hypothetical protein ALI22I_05775 [Saccharothrix sp. ALI-22-I]
MLSDHEQETLREIQRQLVVDDPDFERSFRALDAPEPTPTAGRRWLYPMVIAIASLLAILMLLAGSPGSALGYGLVAGLVWLAQYFHDTAARREHDD